MTLNWILSLKRCKYDKFVVLSFDEELVDFISSKGFRNNTVLIPQSWHKKTINIEANNVGTKTYIDVVHSKTAIFFKLLCLNQEFIFSDIDTVWLHNKVIEYMKIAQRTNDAHILYSQEYTVNKVSINVGFFYAKPTLFTKRLHKELILEQKRTPKRGVQPALYRILERVNYYDKRIDVIGSFIVSSGLFYFIQKIHLKFNMTPMVVHTTLFYNLTDKIHALKKQNLWYVK